MIPYCNAHGIGLIPWSPLHGGDLARSTDDVTTRKGALQNVTSNNKYTEADVEIIRRVRELATNKGWTPAQVSLAWINKKVASPIVGISTVRSLLSRVSR